MQFFKDDLRLNHSKLFLQFLSSPPNCDTRLVSNLVLAVRAFPNDALSEKERRKPTVTESDIISEHHHHSLS
jgi:hypothetical protein